MANREHGQRTECPSDYVLTAFDNYMYAGEKLQRERQAETRHSHDEYE